jgi:hypothetical protein
MSAFLSDNPYHGTFYEGRVPETVNFVSRYDAERNLIHHGIRPDVLNDGLRVVLVFERHHFNGVYKFLTIDKWVDGVYKLTYWRDADAPVRTRWSLLDPFTRQYMETALWAERDEDGEPLDVTYGIEDINWDTFNQMVADCNRFKEENLTDILRAPGGETNDPLSMAGHDFWLTRNRHGSGFGDGEYPRFVGERLRRAAQRYPEIDLFAQDGEVHAEKYSSPDDDMNRKLSAVLEDAEFMVNVLVQRCKDKFPQKPNIPAICSEIAGYLGELAASNTLIESLRAKQLERVGS